MKETPNAEKVLSRYMKIYVAGHGDVTQPIKRAQLKRPAGVSARQWKKMRGKGKAATAR